MIFHLPQTTVQKLKSSYFPIVYTIFFLGFFIFPSTKFHNNFFYLTTAFPFAGMIIFRKTPLKKILLNRIFIIAALFSIYMGITLFWSRQSDFWDIFQYGRHVVYILLFLCISMHLLHENPEFLNRLLSIYCFTAALVSVFYPIYFYLNNPFPKTRLIGYGMLYNPIAASSLFGIALIGCLYFLHQQKSNKTRLIYLAMISAFFFYILLAQARGPFLALLISLMAWPVICLLTGKSQIKISRNTSIILLGLLAAGASLFLLFPEFYKYFFTKRGFSYRFEIWGLFFEKIISAPWIGHGWNMDTRTLMSDGTRFLHPHSVYVATLSYGGIIGLALLFSLIGYSIFQAIKIKETHHRFLVVCMLIFGTICIATDGSTLLQHPKPFWIFFWFPIALCAVLGLKTESKAAESEHRTFGRKD